MAGVEIDGDAERGEDELPERHLVVRREDLLPAENGRDGAVLSEDLRGRVHDGFKQKARVVDEVFGRGGRAVRADVFGRRKKGRAARVVAPQHEARRIGGRIVDDGDVDEAVAHVVGGHLGTDVEDDARMRFRPFGNELREIEAAEVDGGRKRNVPQGARRRKGFPDALKARKERRHGFEEIPAAGRGPHRAMRPLKELEAELVLQFGEDARNLEGRKIRLQRRLADAARARRGLQNAPGGQIVSAWVHAKAPSMGLSL